MRLALIQQHATADKADNLNRGLKAVRTAAAQGAELVCFAELAFEPFYPQKPSDGNHRDHAEPIPGPSTDAFCSLAKELGVVIVPNLYELAGDETYDTSPIIDADGRLIGAQRMVHIPDYEGFHEKTYYTPGDFGAPVFTTTVGRIGVAICYDRHYPETMRALALGGADLVLVPQAGAVDEWPEGLFEAEMRVAAFQNGFFVALCNRVGSEELLEFAGESFVCDPEGRVIARAAKAEDDILICDINLEQAASSHARKLFLPDRRPELYGHWLEADATPELTAEPGKNGNVSLRVLAEETLRPILSLSRQMMPGQERMVAPNAVSIAQAHFNDKAWFRGVYADDTAVGFVMLYDDKDKPEYFLWRLMIAGPHQGKGYGRQAMLKLIKYVKGRPGATELKASYVPIPGGPESFYRSLGFESTGEMDGDEVVISLKL